MKYATRTDSAIKEALLKLLESKKLADITVSELACEAGISRSTFYGHYGNPADVYDALVAQFAAQLSPMVDQIACSDSPRPAKKPFCTLIRDDGPLSRIIDDDRFLASFLVKQNTVRNHDMHGVLVRAGYSEKEATALCAFQLSGCFSAAQSTAANDEEWEDIRAVIDRFILGGLSACLAAKSEPRRSASMTTRL